VSVSGARLGGIGVGRQPIVATAYHPASDGLCGCGIGETAEWDWWGIRSSTRVRRRKIDGTEAGTAEKLMWKGREKE